MLRQSLLLKFRREEREPQNCVYKLSCNWSQQLTAQVDDQKSVAVSSRNPFSGSTDVWRKTTLFPMLTQAFIQLPFNHLGLRLLTNLCRDHSINFKKFIQRKIWVCLRLSPRFAFMRSEEWWLKVSVVPRYDALMNVCHSRCGDFYH